MPKATDQSNTGSPSRRGVLVGGAALASAGALAVPALAGPQRPSPEFVACQLAWRAYVIACAGDDDNDAEIDAACRAHSAALEALVAKIEAKAVCTPQDVFELAKAQAVSGYEDGKICLANFIGDSTCEIEHVIVAAALKMGGADV